MKTLRLCLTSAVIGADPALLEAAEILRRGGLVAFPTETVYGLGANALDARAVEKIFAAKQRPHWDPVIVHVADVAGARRLTLAWPEAAERLAEAFWPGPLTMLLPRNAQIPDVCTAGREKAGLRLPSHPVAMALIAAAGVPVAAPSANRFGHTSPTTAGHVLADLEGRIDAILDAGACEVGVESTVIDPTVDPPIIYRPGGITPEQIRHVLGRVVVAEHKIARDGASDCRRSPAGVAGISRSWNSALCAASTTDSGGEPGRTQPCAGAQARSHQVGVLLPKEWSVAGLHVTTLPWGSWSDPKSLARDLYLQLRALDDRGVDVIVCPMPHAGEASHWRSGTVCVRLPNEKPALGGL